MGSDVPLAREGADRIRLGFENYRKRFRDITRLARRRFEQREWREAQRDSAQRLTVRRQVFQEVLVGMRSVLAQRFADREVWREIRLSFAAQVRDWEDVELAETFFNSITRHVFATVGVDPLVEFVGLDFKRAHYPTRTTIHRTFDRTSTTRALLREILDDVSFSVPWRDLAGDTALAADRVDRFWTRRARGWALESIAIIDTVFYRDSGAYLVGRMNGGVSAAPIVIVLVNREEGIEVDAVLLTEAEVSIVFSFTRSSFRVDLACPSQVVRLLCLALPRKPAADLYISLGHNKHGKTEMYRSLLAHKEDSTECFDFAPGDVGMVMIVFGMPTHEYVFKVIRDQFAYPKTCTRDDVRRAYQLVFKHDRAGRLVDAQQFEHLTFDRARFTPELLAELESAAAESVTITEYDVTIHLLYIERRVQPLNLYLREALPTAAADALLDYGQAIRDLAAANIFPGDLLTKNFGVTRRGRVIFYDYDELCRVTDCHFRDLPAARSGDEEVAAEPWFYVGQNDVFPEEFIRFLGLDDEQRAHLVDAHGPIFDAGWWRRMQERHNAGEVLEIFPYSPSQRLRPEPGASTWT